MRNPSNQDMTTQEPSWHSRATERVRGCLAYFVFFMVPFFSYPHESVSGEPPRDSRAGLLIGIEYAMPGPAADFGKMGVPLVKFYPDEIPWGKMQKSADSAIDFRAMDWLVKEYQDAGFQELMICLKSLSSWASKQPATTLATATPEKRQNLAPKPEHLPAYAKWVRAVVERYDHDGQDDMPGLRRPVRLYEVGSEYSSFEPEPADEYLPMLAAAHEAAHAAYSDVVLMHAAILATGVFRDHPKPAQVDAAFAAASKQFGQRILHKSLAEIRAVLDKPQWFDAVNFHALGDPYEIEDHVAWLRFEMKKRGYGPSQ